MVKVILGILFVLLSLVGFYFSIWAVQESGLDHPLWTYSPPFILSAAVLIVGVMLLWKGYKAKINHHR